MRKTCVPTVTCPRCGYSWEYRGKRYTATCPNCRYTFTYTSQVRPNGRKSDNKAGIEELGNGVVLINVQGNDLKKLNQKELWEKAGAKVVQATKDDRVVVLDVPDDKADEVIQRFYELASKV